MPIIEVHHKADVTLEQKRQLSAKMTQDFAEVLGRNPSAVRIIWQEMADDSFAIGGQLICDKK